jgi:NAD-dependent deacetylase
MHIMEPIEVPHQLISRLLNANAVTVITGAGMSAESGIPTFRDISTGFWARFDAYELASPEGWKADKARVWAWYEWRRGLVRNAIPHAGHRAIAELPQAMNRAVGRATGNDVQFTLVTQNVDDLHERAGSEGALHVHGSLFAPRCAACGRAATFAHDPPKEAVEHIAPPRCEHCEGYVRPGVVWFGEQLDVALLSKASHSAQNCDVLLVIGTSGVVRPVADLPQLARKSGAWVCEINPLATEVSSAAHLCWRATAAQSMPALLSCLGSSEV